jgi:hypothetical protein
MDPGASDEAVKRMRGRLLDDLKDGDIYFESTATREIGLMLAGMPAMVDWLISKADWHVLVTPSDRQFILSDAPVTHYDPTPKMPGAGAGFDSSPGAMTFIPIDPCIGLLIRPSPDELLNWRTRPIDRALVRPQSAELCAGGARDLRRFPGDRDRSSPRRGETESGSRSMPGVGPASGFPRMSTPRGL